MFDRERTVYRIMLRAGCYSEKGQYTWSLKVNSVACEGYYERVYTTLNHTFESEEKAWFRVKILPLAHQNGLRVVKVRQFAEIS